MSATSPKDISINEYNYELPDDRIALTPLENRAHSKLLVYKNHSIETTVFENIFTYLPENSLLVFNNSKVIKARLQFEKKTGSVIEIFCLEPADQISEYATAMNTTQSTKWKCFVGGASKWKEPFLEKIFLLNSSEIVLKARIFERITDAYIIEFSWSPSEYTFAEIITAAGKIPLPPYIKRAPLSSDDNRYQTVYAAQEGSVAAPTAGLHFTKEILQQTSTHHINQAHVTLHVGAGTFKPVKAASMKDHEMHAEWIEISADTINNLLQHKEFIIAVGTTSLRTLESIYWLGVKTIINPTITKLELGQWDVYDQLNSLRKYSIEQSLESLLHWLQQQKKEKLFTQTQLLITPGYSFKMVKAIFTNFHQPKSTLLLLVAAAIGNDWKKCYQYALENDFRFLSYGDTSLLFMAES